MKHLLSIGCALALTVPAMAQSPQMEPSSSSPGLTPAQPGVVSPSQPPVGATSMQQGENVPTVERPHGHPWRAWFRKKNPKPADVTLEPGQQLVKWPDGTQVVVTQDGFLVHEVRPTPVGVVGDSGVEPIDNEAYVISRGDQLTPVGEQAPVDAEGGTLEGNQVYKKSFQTWMPVRTSPMAPGHNYIDEDGRRISVNRQGDINTNASTPISLVPGGAPGTTLVAEREMQPNLFQRIFGIAHEPKLENKGNPYVIPSQATLDIVPPGANIAAVQPTPVAVGGVALTRGDTTLIREFVQTRLRSANLSTRDYLRLPPAAQRDVMQGQATNLQTVPRMEQAGLPKDLQRQLVKDAVVPPEVVARYAVPLPATLEPQLTPLPEGYQRVLMGQDLVVLSDDGRIVQVLPNFIG
jgi:hypothetical protein